MPDSLEKTLKLLIKAGILPKKKKRKNKKYTRVSKRQILENFVKQNSNPISYGQPNLSHLSANNQIAFTENRNKQLDYENNFDNYLNPHIKRINDKIFETSNSFNNKITDTKNIFNEQLVNTNDLLNNKITDTNKSLDGLIYYADDLYKEVKNQFNTMDTRFNKILPPNLATDNIDVSTNTGTFVPQKANDNSNSLIYDNNNNDNYSTPPPINLNIKNPNNINSNNNVDYKDAYSPNSQITPQINPLKPSTPTKKQSIKSKISHFTGINRLGLSKKKEIPTPTISLPPIIPKNNISKNNFDKLKLDEDDEYNLDNWVNSKGNKRGIGLKRKNLEKRRKEKENNNIKEYDEKKDN
jgi:hypothetical protein